MANEPRFLLGKGERLTQPIAYRSGFGPAAAPYSWEGQRQFLYEQLDRQAAMFDELPAAARPDDRVVSVLRLHPQYYSRSAFPSELLREADLRFIGSKPAFVKPRAGRGADFPEGLPSTDVFVTGKRQAFSALRSSLDRLVEDEPLVADLLKLEGIRPLIAAERVQTALPARKSTLEVVVHFDPSIDGEWEDDFRHYAKQCHVTLAPELEFQSRGLWFLTAEATAESAEALAQFVFVRAVRPMPKLRIVEAPRILRTVTPNSSVQLPVGGPVDPDMRVAIFDGGLPDAHPFMPWARNIEPAASDNLGAPISDFQQHGLAVTSALLFGHVQPGLLPVPYCRVDHYRVLGDQVKDRQLYSVLLYIDKILSSTQIDLANFSFGPDEIIGDDQVTAWTTMLDDHFHDRGMLATIAVGNNGDANAPHNRIQVPSDCVNALAVGASDGNAEGWKRAPYSCIGPGRAPGVIKPDLVSFGGTEDNQFHFLFPGALHGDAGTSYAAPNLLRTAAGLRAHFGRDLSNLALRALLIHTADDHGHHRHEVGWGQPPTDPADIAICDEHSVRILYQGTLDPAKVVRAEIPLPDLELLGKVTIRATVCYLCRTDANSPGDYTRAGLDITFRPHVDKLTQPSDPETEPDPNYPATATFFQGVGRKSEQQLRSDAYKWDTVRHAEHNFYASSLKRPVFDIHYVARTPGYHTPRHPDKLTYALVVTITAKRNPELYEQVREKYRLKLEALQPRAELPVRVDIDVPKGHSI